MRLAEVSTNGGYQGTVNCTILTIRSANGMRMNQLSLFGAIFLLKQVAISVTLSLTTKPIGKKCHKCYLETFGNTEANAKFTSECRRIIPRDPNTDYYLYFP